MLETLSPEYLTEVRFDEQHTTVVVWGDLDYHSAYRLARTLKLLSMRREPIMVDVSNVRHLDSSGVLALLRAHKWSAGNLHVSGCPPRLRRLFHKDHVDHLLAA